MWTDWSVVFPISEWNPIQKISWKNTSEFRSFNRQKPWKVREEHSGGPFSKCEVIHFSHVFMTLWLNEKKRLCRDNISKLPHLCFICETDWPGGKAFFPSLGAYSILCVSNVFNWEIQLTWKENMIPFMRYTKMCHRLLDYHIMLYPHKVSSSITASNQKLTILQPFDLCWILLRV